MSTTKFHTHIKQQAKLKLSTRHLKEFLLHTETGRTFDTYILFILLHATNALGGTSVMAFCSSRLQTEYINIISDVIINVDIKKLVAKQQTRYN